MARKREKKTREERRAARRRRVFIAILASYILTIGFVVYRMITIGDGTEPVSGRTLPDYAKILLECILGLVLMFLPSILAKRFTFEIPSGFYAAYVVFIYCAIYLGEVWSFFYLIKGWDVMLHGFSAIGLGIIGFTLVNLLNKDEHVRLNLSPFFVAFFAFCFALAAGAVWEIIEFTIDGVLGFNMQKFALQDGTRLVGRAALSDTMKDIIVDTCGALIAQAAGYLTIMKDRAGKAGPGDGKSDE